MQNRTDRKKLNLVAFPPAAVMLVAAVLLALCLAACEWGFELDVGSGDDTPSGVTPDVPVGTSGLAITGIPSAYNGKYALAMGISAGFSLTGAESYSASTLSFKAVRIAGGKAVLPVWKLNMGDTAPVRYYGNDPLYLTLGIFDAETISTQDMDNYTKSAFIYVYFYNGNASYDGPNIQ